MNDTNVIKSDNLEELKPLETKEDQERTAVKKKQFLVFYRDSLGCLQESLDKTEISRECYHNWLKKDPNFVLSMKEAWEYKLDAVEALASKLMFKEDGAMIRHFLDRRHPLYKPRVKVETPAPGEMGAEQDFNNFLNNGDNKSTETEIHRDEVKNKEQEGTDGSVRP